VTTLILYFLGEPIMGFFFSDPVSIVHGRDYLQVLSASQLLQGLTLLTSSAFFRARSILYPLNRHDELHDVAPAIGEALSATSLGVKGIWVVFFHDDERRRLDTHRDFPVLHASPGDVRRIYSGEDSVQ